MKTLVAVVAVALGASMASAGVWTEVYGYDGTTPLAPPDPNDPHVYGDIMVGTHLVLVVNSDTDGSWYGSLEMLPEDWLCGTLSGREYNPETGSYDGSVLPDAGGRLAAGSSGSAGTAVYFEGYTLDGAHRTGFDFNAHFRSVPGKWFVLDYFAEQPGPCHVQFYDLDTDFDHPQDVLSFRHVPSRDFQGDAVVDFEDFARLAWHWRLSLNGAEPVDGMEADLDASGHVDGVDLAAFCRYWLERSDSPGFSSPSAAGAAEIRP